MKTVSVEEKFREPKIDNPRSGQSQQNIYKLGQFLAPLTNWIKPAKPAPPAHLDYVGVPINSIGGFNVAGHKFEQKIIGDSIKMVGADTVEQDIVVSRTSNEGAAFTAYREYCVRFRETSRNSGLTVARVDYASDRTILRKDIFKGPITTDWSHAANRIVELTGQPWETLCKLHGL